MADPTPQSALPGSDLFPCAGCPNNARCATKGLACEYFYGWAKAGARWDEKYAGSKANPTRKYYRLLFPRDTVAGGFPKSMRKRILVILSKCSDIEGMTSLECERVSKKMGMAMTRYQVQCALRDLARLGHIKRLPGHKFIISE
jgi:hypothetical protein